MSWQPIEKYDAMKNKPPLVLFRFAPVERPDRPQTSLQVHYDTRRVFGHRTCTHFQVIEPVEGDKL